jgi:hypothetical protein
MIKLFVLSAATLELGSEYPFTFEDNELPMARHTAELIVSRLPKHHIVKICGNGVNELIECNGASISTRKYDNERG